MAIVRPNDVWRNIVDALQIDMIGSIGTRKDDAEILPQSFSQGYLTGFLVPTGAAEGQQGLEFEDG
jgi:hypothetical protein